MTAQVQQAIERLTALHREWRNLPGDEIGDEISAVMDLLAPPEPEPEPVEHVRGDVVLVRAKDAWLYDDRQILRTAQHDITGFYQECDSDGYHRVDTAHGMVWASRVEPTTQANPHNPNMTMTLQFQVTKLPTDTPYLPPLPPHASWWLSRDGAITGATDRHGTQFTGAVNDIARRLWELHTAATVAEDVDRAIANDRDHEETELRLERRLRESETARIRTEQALEAARQDLAQARDDFDRMRRTLWRAQGEIR